MVLYESEHFCLNTSW